MTESKQFLTQLIRIFEGKHENNNLLKKKLLIIVAVTAVAFLLSETVFTKILSLSTYSGRDESFSYSDFYVRTASHGVARMSRDIVLVDIGDLSRAGMAALLDSLSRMEPKAVALDVFFRFPGQEGDDLLTDAVCRMEGLVLPRDVNRPGLVSFFQDEVPNARIGAVNLSAGTARDVIRNYRPAFDTPDGPLESFGLAVAAQVRPDLAEQVLQRGDTSGFIRFDGMEFPMFDAGEILSGDASVAETVRGRAVFVGDLNDPQDRHLTPADPEMPGLLVHAKIAQTVLSGKPVKELPRWAVVLIAVLVCSFWVWLLQVIRDRKWGPASSLLVRLSQFLLMYLFFVIGYREYAGAGYLVDFSLPMMMLGLGSLANDLVFGSYDLYVKVRKWFITQILKKR